MRYTKPRKGSLELNMTSMLDIVFQLIIFFIMVTNFAAADLPPLEPPEGTEAFSSQYPFTRVINIVPFPEGKTPGSADHVLVGGVELPINPGGMKQLTDLLKNEQNTRPDIKMHVRLRVDKGLHYDQVQPVMEAVTNAGIARVNLVAIMADE